MFSVGAKYVCSRVVAAHNIMRILIIAEREGVAPRGYFSTAQEGPFGTEKRYMLHINKVVVGLEQVVRVFASAANAGPVAQQTIN